MGGDESLHSWGMAIGHTILREPRERGFHELADHGEFEEKLWQGRIGGIERREKVVNAGFGRDGFEFGELFELGDGYAESAGGGLRKCALVESGNFGLFGRKAGEEARDGGRSRSIVV